MPCKCCNGTGDIPSEAAWHIFDETGERPNQRFGCGECNGLGEVEGDE